MQMNTRASRVPSKTSSKPVTPKNIEEENLLADKSTAKTSTSSTSSEEENKNIYSEKQAHTLPPTSEDPHSHPQSKQATSGPDNIYMLLLEMQKGMTIM